MKELMLSDSDNDSPLVSSSPPSVKNAGGRRVQIVRGMDLSSSEEEIPAAHLKAPRTRPTTSKARLSNKDEIPVVQDSIPWSDSDDDMRRGTASGRRLFNGQQSRALENIATQGDQQKRKVSFAQKKPLEHETDSDCVEIVDDSRVDNSRVAKGGLGHDRSVTRGRNEPTRRGLDDSDDDRSRFDHRSIDSRRRVLGRQKPRADEVDVDYELDASDDNGTPGVRVMPRPVSDPTPPLSRYGRPTGKKTRKVTPMLLAGDGDSSGEGSAHGDDEDDTDAHGNLSGFIVPDNEPVSEHDADDLPSDRFELGKQDTTPRSRERVSQSQSPSKTGRSRKASEPTTSTGRYQTPPLTSQEKLPVPMTPRGKAGDYAPRATPATPSSMSKRSPVKRGRSRDESPPRRVKIKTEPIFDTQPGETLRPLVGSGLCLITKQDQFEGFQAGCVDDCPAYQTPGMLSLGPSFSTRLGSFMWLVERPDGDTPGFDPSLIHFKRLREVALFKSFAKGLLLNASGVDPDLYGFTTRVTPSNYTYHALTLDDKPVDMVYIGYIGQDGSYLNKPTSMVSSASVTSSKQVCGVFVHPLNGFCQRSYAFLHAVFSKKNQNPKLSWRGGLWQSTTIPGDFPTTRRPTTKGGFALRVDNREASNGATVDMYVHPDLARIAKGVAQEIPVFDSRRHFNKSVVPKDWRKDFSVDNILTQSGMKPDPRWQGDELPQNSLVAVHNVVSMNERGYVQFNITGVQVLVTPISTD